jgi:type II secretory pathway pseudopilin PulG
MNRIRKRRRQGGSTLIETMVATALMLVVSAGVMALAATSLATSENQGHLAARTSEYCQDKLEQLLALSFNDSTSNTTTIPTSASGGTGLTIGGSSSPGSPVTGYVDYLDITGNILTVSGNTAPSGWYYVRVWSIAAGPAGATNSKLITVTTQVDAPIGAAGAVPQSTVAALKVNPF